MNVRKNVKKPKETVQEKKADTQVVFGCIMITKRIIRTIHNQKSWSRCLNFKSPNLMILLILKPCQIMMCDECESYKPNP